MQLLVLMRLEESGGNRERAECEGITCHGLYVADHWQK